MRFLSLYTPAVNAGGPPDPEHMAAMGAFMEEGFKSGVLIDTGGLLKRQTGGMRATLKDGKFTVEDNPAGESMLLDASGYAILEAPNKAELAKTIKQFLRLAGDGRSEIIQLMDMPPR
ncbi:MAG TPA: hypothetical protein VHZ26_01110 [Caulobacteraceae bacterium]|jgi:hypothetical protein|nr:hypothetical protein [Caulobacteraceae bacterium]